jgi:hypothetical protein
LEEGFVKINFDDASKGNMNLAGAGGIFRKHHGEPIFFCAFP